MAVQIVCDTTAYLPTKLVDELGIERVSLSVHMGEHSQREIDMPDFDAFYDDLRSSGRLPTTSQPSIGEFCAVYEKALDKGDEVVSIHLSDGLSGTYQSALQARDRLIADDRGGDRVTVIDSRSACGGLGLMVIAAARAARAGQSSEEISERVEAVRQAVGIWFAVDTLEYLKRGGRIGPASAWIGSTMKIKPILTVEGEIRPIERVRTHSRAVARIVEYGSHKFENEDTAFLVQHIQAPELAAKTDQSMEQALGTRSLFCSEIGPVIGTHIGPGLIGIAVAPAKLLAPEHRLVPS